jgi:ELWxxDGT repeat protein
MQTLLLAVQTTHLSGVWRKVALCLLLLNLLLPAQVSAEGDVPLYAPLPLPTSGDGVPGVRMVKSITDSFFDGETENGRVRALVTTDTYLYFLAGHPHETVPNFSWWRSDGTEAGTQRILDLSRGYELNPLPPLGGLRNAYLWVITADQRAELYRSNGGPAQLVTTLAVAAQLWQQAMDATGAYYYLTGRPNDPLGGYTIWRIAPDGGAPARIWESGPQLGAEARVLLYAAASRVYVALEIDWTNIRLWSPTPGEIHPAPLATPAVWPDAFDSSGDRFYWADVVNGQTTLWRTNGTLTSTVALTGTEAITQPVRHIVAAPQGVYVVSASSMDATAPNAATTLWQTDLTPGVTTQIFAKAGVPLSQEAYWGGWEPQLRDKFLTIGIQKPNDMEMWKIEGAQVTKVPIPAGVLQLKFAHEQIFFFAGTKEFGTEPYYFDGVKTELLLDLFPGDASGAIFISDYGDVISSVVFKNVFYFAGTDGVRGNELWRSDGSAAGTFLVRDVIATRNNLPPRYSSIGSLTAGYQYVHFMANDGLHGNKLWRSDGTADGTQRNDVLPTSEEFALMIARGDVVYLLGVKAGNTYGPYAIWRTDGSAGGTRQLGAGFYAPPAMRLVGGRLVVAGSSSDSGPTQVWRADAEDTTLEPVLELDGRLGYVDRPAGNGAVGSYLYFQLVNAQDQSTWWRSDGTPTGTTQLGVGITGALWDSGNEAYTVVTDDAVHYAYLYTDGTPNGAKRIYRWQIVDHSDFALFGPAQLWNRKLYTLDHRTSPRPTLLSIDPQEVKVVTEMTEGTRTYKQRDAMLSVGDKLYIKEYVAVNEQNVLYLWRGIGNKVTRWFGMSTFRSLDEGAEPQEMQEVQGVLYFTAAAHNPISGDLEVALFRKLPDASPPQLLTWAGSYRQPLGISAPSVPMVPLGDRLFFVGYDPVHGRELWIAENSPSWPERLFLPSVQK